MSEDAPEPYEVFYTNGVVSFMIDAIWSKRVYEKVDSYRSLLAQFPDLGTPCDPVYAAARPPFPCRHIAVPDTPFRLFYLKDDDARRVVVFYIEHVASDPEGRFDWAVVDV